MRYAIIADIHANLAAFTAVLDDIERGGGVDEFWCLGDIVGYGPDPHQCIELLHRRKHICVAGNHDLGAIGKADISLFNPNAARACHWTSQQLSPADVKFLEKLPLSIAKGEFTLVHGSPRQPVWEYVSSTSIALQNFSFFRSQFCLTGHSHVPVIFRYKDDSCSASRFTPSIAAALGQSRLIINPGGVGQPRDGDPRASYAIYDSQAQLIRLYRVSYDIEVTQNKMMEAGLPVPLVTRLSTGV